MSEAMTPELSGLRVRRVLKELVEVLTSGTMLDREAAWSIVSALRGPDQQNGDSLKAETTEYLRGALITWAGADPLGFVPNLRLQPPHHRLTTGGIEQALMEVMKIRSQKPDDHFVSHLQVAVQFMERLGIIDADGNPLSYKPKEVSS